MTCQEAKDNLPLLLYGELTFDEEEKVEGHLERCVECQAAMQRQRALHEAFDTLELHPTVDLLAQNRMQLRKRVAATSARTTFWERLRQGFTIHVHPIPAGMQPVGALALIAMGFFGARMLPTSSLGGNVNVAGVDSRPMTSRVRYVEPEQSGKVQIVVEETRQRVLSGKVDDQSIQNLLLAAAQDPQDPGLRVESVDLLKSRPESAEVRNALLGALQHDTNPGVRLKALDGLRGSAADPQVRQVLAQILLTDDNPGVRTQAIDLLIQHKSERMVGVLQELMRKEDNGYVRLRCEKALKEMNASVETY